MKIEPKYLVLASLAAAIVALDQATKIYIHTQFQLGQSLVVIADYFNITYVRNPGAAFGILSEAPEMFRRVFFFLMTPLALAVILLILRGVPSNDRVQVLALSLIFGGAIGNYIDRLRFGFVIDFLDFHWRNLYAWPAFNVADSAIVVGVGLLILAMFTTPPTVESGDATTTGP